jgi:hypothetical protein
MIKTSTTNDGNLELKLYPKKNWFGSEDEEEEITDYDKFKVSWLYNVKITIRVLDELLD